MSGLGSTEILFRLIVSSILGGCIGLERELKNKSAGFVTLILVCLGSTTIALLQEELLIRQINLITAQPNLIESYKLDITRLSAQVITGVGFIGGGAIVYSNDKVSGITTAATLWITAAIGLAVGYGFIFLSTVSFLIVVLTLIGMKILERKVITMVKNKKAVKYNLEKEGQKIDERL
ncbi:MgtC/SapB family protein [Cetobacterium sp. 2A]|uniref:MgtC/SapB family protein n=1 Tax=unclassified Cetobacterium TaxID=2630983 RepID=UPI00163B9F56|nr:MgtC/SapB family protein [Cetobacterium sp. 2A]MBC2855205.1 MgtC/SapB family protein [Cetobacterium sp. 2A]